MWEAVQLLRVSACSHSVFARYTVGSQLALSWLSVGSTVGSQLALQFSRDFRNHAKNKNICYY